MDRWMDGWMDGWINGWIDGWMDGWMDGCMDVWMDGWMIRWNVLDRKGVFYTTLMVESRWFLPWLMKRWVCSGIEVI